MGAVVASFTKNGQVCQVLLRTAKKFYQLIRGHVLESVSEGSSLCLGGARWRQRLEPSLRSGRNYFTEKR